MIRFTNKHLRPAIIVSSTVHLLGLVAFAAWSAFFVTRSEFAGERLVIQITALQPVSAVELPQVKFFTPTSEEIPPQPTRVEIEPRKTTQQIPQAAPQVVTVNDLQLVKLNSEIGKRYRETNMLDELAQTLAKSLPKSPPAAPLLDTKAEVPVKKPSPAEQPPVVQQQPSTVGVSDKTPPDLSRNNPPPYPAVAVQQGWEGTVILRVSIDDRGVVTSAEVATSCGYEILDKSPVESIRRWKGKPAYQQGKPIATVELLPVRFKLR